MLGGQWLDGRSTRARRVRLERAGDDRLRIVDLADGAETFWPMAEIEVGARLGATPRVLRRAGHGQIECPDSPELAQWFRRPAGGIEAVADWLERRRLAILGAAAAAALFAFAFLRLGVPWAAERIAVAMPVAVEAEVSRQAVTLLERGHLAPSRLPAARRSALRRRFGQLVQGEPRQADMRLHFARAPGLGANALALPDGRIYLTDELVELAADDDEILAVLAHEAGHHVHRHGMRQAIESSSVLLVVGLAFGDVSGSSLAVALPTVLLTSGYSRGHEREADAYALGLLGRRGISPRAFGRIMRRLAGDDAAPAGAVGYLSTHPPTVERIEAAERAGRGPGE
ncbi:M48 family metallopeptidase [Luteimonas sp. RD2P54]|uniref:M48 family metallopeptidase n=1 Tax=Luteimonas endophytica TaxID=3042023 RepID=A0ABT6JC40_9GAMM|nr:M48 family metallopeptidase [Luteimonas endophytica]MDH5824182.1 M48 family metallopeptidase [Luteimonas endophytica]